MPTGKPRCPVCQGKGTLTENAKEYEFTTRDPITSKCLVCNGEGWLNYRTTLTNGKRVFDVFRKEKLPRISGDSTDREQMTQNKGLNVSRKALVEDKKEGCGLVGSGIDGGTASAGTKIGGSATAGTASPGIEKGTAGKSRKHNEKPVIGSEAMSPRLIKVLASGKEFLIVTETEPYYLTVYSLIRNQERKQGTWSWEDEEAYIEAIMAERQRVITEIAVMKGQDDATTKKEVNNG